MYGEGGRTGDLHSCFIVSVPPLNIPWSRYSRTVAARSSRTVAAGHCHPHMSWSDGPSARTYDGPIIGSAPGNRL